MLKETLNGNIQLAKSAANWREAIRAAAQPLLASGAIEDRYIDAMIKNIEVNGPYVVIIPNLAIPHAKPEHGVLKTAISLLKLDQPVLFPEDKSVQVLIVLAPCHPDIHLELMSELTDLLIDEEQLNKLYAATDASQIKELL